MAHPPFGPATPCAATCRSLATRPRFIVCDEPVSALDVSVQATVVNLLADLRDEFGLPYLFISHDLAVVAQLFDRIAVMYCSRVCETGTAAEVLGPPFHPYTRALLASVAHERPTEVERSGTAEAAVLAPSAPAARTAWRYARPRCRSFVQSAARSPSRATLTRYPVCPQRLPLHPTIFPTT